MMISYRHRRDIKQRMMGTHSNPQKTKPTQIKQSKYGFSPSNSDRTKLDILLRSGTSRGTKTAVTLPSLGTWGDNADDI